MNVLTHAVHTGYQFDLAKTGHNFYCVDIPGSPEVFWDSRLRPQPGNFHRVRFADELPVRMDLALAHFQFGYDCLKHSNLPLIYKEHCIRQAFQVPSDWVVRIAYYCFASTTAAEPWRLPEEFNWRKVIIGMGMDLQTYRGYKGGRKGVLVVGQNIRSRGNEKGLDNLLQIAQDLPVTVVGIGNEGIPGACGIAERYEDLQSHYREHRVFFNPSNTMNMATLEAMATGMPVVTFRMVNSDVIVHEINGYVVDSVKDARACLAKLLDNPQLARMVGRRARALVEQRFRTELFLERWNALFHKAVAEHAVGRSWPGHHDFKISSKNARERELAELVAGGTFEYERVGYEKRPMKFLCNGRIGKGGGGCELFWDVKCEEGQSFLDIYSGCALTCRLKRDQDGNWRGRWSHFERMPVVLSVANP